MESIDMDSKGAAGRISRILSQRLRTAFAGALRVYAPVVIDRADENREFVQFTGNTVSSYAAGIYDNGVLVGTVSDSGARVAHPKVRKGETVRLENPVEGLARELTGTVDIVTPYGMELSERMLQEERPPEGTGMVVTTGTEYSGYLERVHDLDVLTDTFRQTRASARREIQGIIDKACR